MKKRGQIIAISVLVGAIACGSSPQSQTSQKLDSIPLQQQKQISKSPSQNNLDVLMIGGADENLKSILQKLSSLDLKDQNSRLAAFWGTLDHDGEFKNDFEKEIFFTVVNKIDPNTRNMTLDHSFGLDTSVTSFSRRDNQIVAESVENEPANYSLTLGNRLITMNWDKKENRFIPASDSASALDKEPVSIELQRNGKRIIQTGLPLFTIQDQDLKNLSNLTLNLDKDGYADPIQITPTSNENKSDCFLISAWKSNDKEQVVLFTNFVDFENKQIHFDGFELEKLQKLRGLTLNDKTGASMICYNMQHKSDENPFYTFTISSIPVKLKITDNADNKGKPTENEKPKPEKSTADRVIPVPAEPLAASPPKLSEIKDIPRPTESSLPSNVEKMTALVNENIKTAKKIKAVPTANTRIIKKLAENKDVKKVVDKPTPPAITKTDPSTISTQQTPTSTTAPQLNQQPKIDSDSNTGSRNKIFINPLDTIHYVKPKHNPVFD